MTLRNAIILQLNKHLCVLSRYRNFLGNGGRGYHNPVTQEQAAVSICGAEHEGKKKTNVIRNCLCLDPVLWQ